MAKAYWVKGYPYKTPDRKEHSELFVIHRFDSLKEAEFFKSQIAHGEILDWGDGKEYNRQKHAV